MGFPDHHPLPLISRSSSPPHPTPTLSIEQNGCSMESCIFYFIFIKLKATVWRQFQNRVKEAPYRGAEKSRIKTD